MVLTNAAGVSSAAGASDGAAAPAITPKARVRALRNRGKAVPATRLTAGACRVTGDDLACSSSRWIRSELVLVRFVAHAVLSREWRTAVELTRRRAAYGRMLVKTHSIRGRLGWRILTRCADRGSPFKGASAANLALLSPRSANRRSLR
jgi:hypothetical protein